MKSKSSFFFIAVSAEVALSCLASVYPGNNSNESRYESPNWRLVWQDNFDGDAIDSTVWGNMRRGRDDSRKYHSSNPACYDLKDGKLTLRGIVNPDLKADTAKYLTGAITTEGKKAFSCPGRIEIKAKIGSAQGAWPAFWLLPFKKDKGWPADGEIDIMEHLNFDSFVYQTVHSSYTKQDRNAKPQRFVMADIKCNDFNTYRVDILPEFIRFFVNDKETLTYPAVDSLLYKGEFPFNRNWYLMLDMQLGGNWPGSINPKDIPVEMEIDWVKYYILPH